MLAQGIGEPLSAPSVLMLCQQCARMALMNLNPYIENVHRQLLAAGASGGDEARATAEQLAPALESAVRLALQDALAAAADEITLELAPRSVELRLRGREPE